jgi:hypothetical protein
MLQNDEREGETEAAAQQPIRRTTKADVKNPQKLSHVLLNSFAR